MTPAARDGGEHAEGWLRSHAPTLARAALGLVFGTVALVWSALTLRLAIAGFGIYLAADGLAAIGAAIRRRPWSILWFVEGLLGVGASLFLLFRPELSTRALVDLASFWLMLTGLLEVAAARRLRHENAVRALALVGAASLAVGLSMFVWPEIAAVWIVRAVGAYGVLFGVGMLVLSFWEARARPS